MSEQSGTGRNADAQDEQTGSVAQATSGEQAEGDKQVKPGKQAKAGKQPKEKKASRKDRKAQAKKAAAVVGDGTNRLRTLAARVIWAVAVVLALVLALGALLIALDANRSNELVSFVLDSAAAVDLGVFSRTDGIKQFDGSNADLKNALFNWGLGALAWLVIGRVLDRVVRP